MGETRKRILVVEDDSLVRRMLVSYFEATEMYDVIDAEDGEAGLARFRAERPDVVMTDLRMPKVDGWEVLAALTAEAPQTPVIVFSGAGDLENALEAVRRGAWDYVTKPIYELSELDIVLKRALERAQLLEENRRYQRGLEALVESRTAALEASERRLAQIVEGAAVGVFVVDAKGAVTHWNRACELITGIGAREVIGTADVRRVFGGGDALVLSDSVLGAREPSVQGLEHFFPGLGEEGKWLFLTAAPLRDAAGDIVGVVETVQDVTPRKRAEEEAARLDERMRHAQKMEALGSLASGIAHDFNNILAGAVGFAEMALDAVPEDGKAAAHLGRVLAALGRAADLVRRILAFGRQPATALSPTRLGAVAREVVGIFETTMPASIRLTLSIEEDETAVLADAGQLGQVVMNLCTNALQAMKDGGGTLAISVGTVELPSPSAEDFEDVPSLDAGRYVRLSVEDTGVGMDEETQKRIFEPYFSTKPLGEGTGLGLAVVHGIVSAHGGAIRVESRPAAGTRFEVLLPVAEAGGGASSSAGLEEAEIRGRERVMFVDDEPQLLALVETALGHLGYRVGAFPNGERAIEAFSAAPGDFDVAILDFVMPGMNGVEVARRLHETRAELPILLCTGFGAELSKAEAARVGIREHISKPTTVKAMAAAIRRAVEGRAAQTKGNG